MRLSPGVVGTGRNLVTVEKLIELAT